MPFSLGKDLEWPFALLKWALKQLLLMIYCKT